MNEGSFFNFNAGDSAGAGPWLIKDDDFDLSVRRCESNFDISARNNLLLDRDDFSQTFTVILLGVGLPCEVSECVEIIQCILVSTEEINLGVGSGWL